MKLNTNDKKQIKDFINAKRCYYLKKNNPFSNIKVTNEGKIEFFVKTNSTLNYYKSGCYNRPWTIHEKPIKKKIQEHNIFYEIYLDSLDRDFIFNGDELNKSEMTGILDYVLIEAQKYFILDRYDYFLNLYFNFPKKNVFDDKREPKIVDLEKYETILNFKNACVMRFNMLSTAEQTILSYNKNYLQIRYFVNPDERGNQIIPTNIDDAGHSIPYSGNISPFDGMDLYDPIKTILDLPDLSKEKWDDYQKRKAKEYYNELLNINGQNQKSDI